MLAMNRDDDTPAWDADSLRSPHTHADKARRVRRMFNTIAPTYELVNRVFSAGRDRYWRRRAVELAGVTSDDIVLDVACGTGDFARAFANAPARPQRLAGCDFAHGMLVRAITSSPSHLEWCECDAQQLPFRASSFTIVCCAFGVRNFHSLKAGLREMHRVLSPGGLAVILEFTRPSNRLIRGIYEVYARRIMPIGARWLSGDRAGAYRYLPESVVSFPSAEEMCRQLERVGFVSVERTPLTFGIVTVYVARKGPHD